MRRALEGALARHLEETLAGAAVLGSYAAVGAEIDPAAIEAACRSCMAFPRATPENELRFHACRSEALAPGFRGIPEPPADAPEVEPDVVLVPLLLFDRRGNRLGQGGGHYDRTLRRLRERGGVLAIGLAWDMQEADALARAPWDEPLDLVATPTRLLSFRAAARGRA
ncbi:5-formyltetrahydrofolate cyclo-ligase [Thermaurantiacus sp.]